MQHLLTHILWWLVSPSNLVLIALVLAALLLWIGYVRTARVLVTATTVLLLLVATLPVSSWLLRPLEDRFPRPRALPAEVAGIIALGGVMNAVVSNVRGVPALSEGAERLTALFVLGRRYPDAKLIFSGGTGSLLTPDMKEAPAARRFLESLGLNAARLEVEDRSRNTMENAIYSRALAQPRPGAPWILVTSARHMPRAVGVFRAAGWEVIPYPVDYLTAESGEPTFRFDLHSGLTLLHFAAREWAALAAYWMLGRTRTLLPSP